MSVLVTFHNSDTLCDTCDARQVTHESACIEGVQRQFSVLTDDMEVQS